MSRSLAAYRTLSRAVRKSEFTMAHGKSDLLLSRAMFRPAAPEASTEAHMEPEQTRQKAWRCHYVDTFIAEFSGDDYMKHGALVEIRHKFQVRSDISHKLESHLKFVRQL